MPYDGKYIFSDCGYNFLPSEISAAFAIEQLKKLKKNISSREKNFTILKMTRGGQHIVKLKAREGCAQAGGT